VWVHGTVGKMMDGKKQNAPIKIMGENVAGKSEK
jgi:hypothetical protein